MDIYALTRQLIDIPSVSGDEDAVARFLAERLEASGYRVELQEVSNGRRNLLALTGEPPRVVLSTHMDTVPPHIPASEDDEYIYGRGACDAKGIIAAQVEAAERLRAAGERRLGLLFTVDEEVASLGAKLANEHTAARACRYLINGEPTDNLLAAGSKGSLRVRIATKGRAAHSAYPEHGESAIERLLDVLAGIRAVEWPRDPFFGETTCNIGTLTGGTRSNVIPAQAEAVLHIRLVTDSAQVMSIIQSVVEGRAEVEYLSVSEPVRLHAVEGFEQCVVRFTTDIPYLRNWGAPLLLGPGSILDAHTEHERVSKRELARAVELYERLARALLANSAEGDEG
ncbi:MAG TPA: M20/M25/M40 family metallo-hydrolase [Pyrinomonadaceae bacterium]|nr:M20/M25/M40 family metallo-hydrolase [Pyrinomonadaceae bacterium]